MVANTIPKYETVQPRIGYRLVEMVTLLMQRHVKRRPRKPYWCKDDFELVSDSDMG